MSRPRNNILTHWLISRNGRYRLPLIEYDESEKRIVSLLPFDRECESTVFINGTLALVRDDMPEGYPSPYDYLADITDRPVKLVKI